MCVHLWRQCVFYFVFSSHGGRSQYWHISTLTCMCYLSDFLNVSNVFTFLTVTCFNGASSLPCAFGGSAEIRHPFIQHTFGRLGSCKLCKMAPLLNVCSASAADGGESRKAKAAGAMLCSSCRKVLNNRVCNFKRFLKTWLLANFSTAWLFSCRTAKVLQNRSPWFFFF